MLTEDLWYRVAGRPVHVYTTHPAPDVAEAYEVVDLTPDLLVCRRLHLWEGPSGRRWIRGGEGEELLFFLKHVLAVAMAPAYPIVDTQPPPPHKVEGSDTAEGGCP